MPFDDNNETLETPVDETPEANVIPAEEQPVQDVPAQEPVNKGGYFRKGNRNNNYQRHCKHACNHSRYSR